MKFRRYYVLSVLGEYVEACEPKIAQYWITCKLQHGVVTNVRNPTIRLVCYKTQALFVSKTINRSCNCNLLQSSVLVVVFGQWVVAYKLNLSGSTSDVWWYKLDWTNAHSQDTRPDPWWRWCKYSSEDSDWQSVQIVDRHNQCCTRRFAEHKKYIYWS